MSSVIEILETIEQSSGTLAKVDYIEGFIENRLLVKTFISAFDPNIVFYVKKFKPKSVSKNKQREDDEILESFISNDLMKLSQRIVTGNAAKDMLQKTFATMTDVQQKWCLRILNKNMRCGIQGTTVNKIWPNLIKYFEVAKANTLKVEFVEDPNDKKKKKFVITGKVKYPVRLEPKFDGLRCIAIKHQGEVTLYTRSGTIITSMKTIASVLKSAPYDDVVLDGEGMGKDWANTNSIMMSSKKFKDDDELVYQVFDSVPYDEWMSQETTEPYSVRLERVKNIVTSINDSRHVKAVEHVSVKNETELLDSYSKYLEMGYEGAMLKKLDRTYEFDRSDNILKLKPITTFEGAIVGHYEGRQGGKREGLFGGFEILLPNGVITNCGGGFNDAMLSEIQLNNPESYIGKIVELEGQPDPTTSNGLTADGKVHFPVFSRFRDVKDVDRSIIEAYEQWEKSH